MPVFDQAESMMDAYNAKGMQFSAIRPTQLGSTEYTLVTIIRDKSGSVGGFKAPLVSSIREAIKSCGLSPRSNNLLVRVVDFNHKVQEVHGFKELRQIDAQNEYDMSTGGGTALFDAIINGARATHEYAKVLHDNDFDVNGIMFVITDGEELDSLISDINVVKQEIDDVIRSEKLESMITILIGVNAGRCSSYLKNLQLNAGINSYEEVKNFDYKVGAKLAQFVSKSVSSQSQAIGSGGPSQVLTFD